MRGLGAILEILNGQSTLYSTEDLDSPLQSHDKVDFWLSSDKEVAGLPRLALETDLLALCVPVLLHELVGTLEDDLALLLLLLLQSALPF